MSEYQSFGIVEFDAEIKAGRMTAQQVLPILDARIANRERAGKKPIARVIEFRNELVREINGQGGMSIPAMPTPVYATKAAQPSLPTDLDQLATAVKGIVPQAELPAFIAKLATI